MLHKKVETLTAIQYKLVHNKVENERGGRNCPKRKVVMEEEDIYSQITKRSKEEIE